MKLILVSLLLGSLCIGCGQTQDASSSTEGHFDQSRYPLYPNVDQTPGELCDEDHFNRLRYPEEIRYCNRDVRRETKDAIIKTYDQEMGYSIGQMQRSQFKIDHFIPLCAGGANSVANLWPQHQTVFRVTDPLEPKVCQLMALGGILQSEVVDLVRTAKFNHAEAPRIIRELERRIDDLKNL